MGIITNGSGAGPILLFIGVTVLTTIWKGLLKNAPQKPVDEINVEKEEKALDLKKKGVSKSNIKILYYIIIKPFIIYSYLNQFSRKIAILTCIFLPAVVALPVTYIHYLIEFETRYNNYQYSFFKNGLDFYPEAYLISIALLVIAVYIIIWLYKFESENNHSIATNNKFSKGEIVKLRSGGPPMTIGSIKTTALGKQNENIYTCSWIDNASGEYREGKFYEQQLDLIESFIQI